VNFIRRFCLVLCALGVFLNVTLSNHLFGGVLNESSSHSKSKQIAFRKVSEDLNLNAFEFEEDVELDESDFDHDVSLFFSNEYSPLLTFKLRSAPKFSYYTHHVRWIKLPLFVQFQNFRI
jgi:hypothetical protein